MLTFGGNMLLKHLNSWFIKNKLTVVFPLDIILPKLKYFPSQYRVSLYLSDIAGLLPTGSQIVLHGIYQVHMYQDISLVVVLNAGLFNWLSWLLSTCICRSGLS